MVKLERFQYLNDPEGNHLIVEPEVGDMVTRPVRKLNERCHEFQVGIVVGRDLSTGLVKVLWSEVPNRDGLRPGHDGTLEIG